MDYPRVPCWICQLAEQMAVPAKGGYEIHCDRCGRYHITPAAASYPPLESKVRPLASSWVYDQNRDGVVPIINSDTVPQLSTLRRLTFAERANRLLLYIADLSPMMGQTVALTDLRLQALLQTYAPDDVMFVESYLTKKGWTDSPLLGEVTELAPEGWMKVDELRQQASGPPQGFVAMWFDSSLQSSWTDGLQPGIQAAGYVAQRIDLKAHNNKICDEIIAEIRRSRFLVADFTGHRGGVYYEAGFAAGLNMPVIYTCRKDHLAQLHFDVRQYNCIDWETPPELRDRLTARISATIGDGPLR